MGAVFSEPDRVYRYHLTRRVDRYGKGRVTFIMLNPSTATEYHDDATITRCIGFAREWGFGNLTVVNLYALRTRSPAILWRHKDPVGSENDDFLRRALGSHGRVVAAWGANARDDRVDHVLTFPGAEKLHVLGLTTHGVPRHPLYMPGDTYPIPWVR